MNTNKKSLYKRHRVVYTDPVSGKFNKIRLISMSLMVLFFFITPWINWDNKQIFLFDLSCYRFYFFGYVFWPQDFILFAVFFLFAVLLLFVVTIYAGRIWCGFLCPQSIWIKMAVFFSRFFEGNRNKRRKIDSAKWDIKIYFLKSLKIFCWLVLSFLTGFTFVAYFIPLNFLLEKLLSLDFNYLSFFWILFFSFFTYLNISWFREQVCFIVCPYSRFQSVMFDENTWLVGYDRNRGEKRGSRKINQRNYKSLGFGDCIDCFKCVNCCPTGIDIRNGLQMECIGCAACIDACNSVMEKMNYPKGLIRYMQENEFLGKKKSSSKYKLFAYIFLLIILIFIFTYILFNKSNIQLNINRNQVQLYNIRGNDLIENFYILKLTNKTRKHHAYKVSILNKKIKYEGVSDFFLGPEETLIFDSKLIINKKDINIRFFEVFFKVQCVDNKNDDFIVRKSKFVAP